VGILPEIFLSPIAGAYVDRWNRRAVMILADGTIGLASLWLAYIFWTESIAVWHVYLVLFVRALGGSFHWPAMQASTSLMVPKEHLARVAGLNQAVLGGINIMGPPLGAFFLALLSYSAVMLVDVGTAALAIVPLLFVPVPQPGRRAGGPEKESIWSEV
ncbi:MAG: MFS transporter, partial [Anaerolineae bacterium]|nr:MFS transporter [Anaerolineae bacterium]NIN95590.1 MFS transporter [Anaerolineae bacterium]